MLVALAATLLAGCVSSMLAHKVVAPPNQSGIRALFADSPAVLHAPEAYSEAWKVRVPRPEADIAVASIEPGDYRFEYDLVLSYPEGRGPKIDRFHTYWRPATEMTRRTLPPRGTVLLLHGYLQDKRFVTPWAIRLAQAGFRCLVVDLRGHGASTGKHISFAQFAAAHVKQARIGGFDWNQADIPAALARTRAPVLFLHGEADHWLSPEHSRSLMTHAPPGSELKLLPRDTHVTLPLQIAPFESAVIGWFEGLSSR